MNKISVFCLATWLVSLAPIAHSADAASRQLAYDATVIASGSIVSDVLGRVRYDEFGLGFVSEWSCSFTPDEFIKGTADTNMNITLIHPTMDLEVVTGRPAHPSLTRGSRCILFLRRTSKGGNDWIVTTPQSSVRPYSLALESEIKGILGNAESRETQPGKTADDPADHESFLNELLPDAEQGDWVDDMFVEDAADLLQEPESPDTDDHQEFLQELFADADVVDDSPEISSDTKPYSDIASLPEPSGSPPSAVMPPLPSPPIETVPPTEPDVVFTEVETPATDLASSHDLPEPKADIPGRSFAGIGAVLMVTKEEPSEVMVLRVFENCPAKLAGLKPGTVIKTIDGANVANWPLSRAVAAIRGEADTTVALTIVDRALAAPRQISIKRLAIDLDTGCTVRPR